MRNLLALSMVIVLVYSGAVFAQGKGQPVENGLFRIEAAIQNANPQSIEDLLAPSMTIRLEDSLYQNISSIYALNFLKEYFKDMTSIKFKFESQGSGKLTFRTKEGKKKSEYVDVWLGNSDMGGPVISALNISNYPTATIFFRHSKAYH